MNKMDKIEKKRVYDQQYYFRNRDAINERKRCNYYLEKQLLPKVISTPVPATPTPTLKVQYPIMTQGQIFYVTI